MTRYLGKDIQVSIYEALGKLFAPELIKLEWSVRRGAADTFDDAASYAPRLDVAVGPFNLTLRDRERDANTIRSFRHPLIESLEGEVSKQNHGGVYANRNPRCLLAIEIEHSTSSKHILGAITNTSMLGRLGVLIGSSARLTKVKRIHAYACKLKEVEKAHDDMFGNVACFEQGQFLDFLRSHEVGVARRMG
jgi:hypothetical protein